MNMAIKKLNEQEQVKAEKLFKEKVDIEQEYEKQAEIMKGLKARRKEIDNDLIILAGTAERFRTNGYIIEVVTEHEKIFQGKQFKKDNPSLAEKYYTNKQSKEIKLVY